MTNKDLSYLIMSCTPATMQPFVWSMHKAETFPCALRIISHDMPLALLAERLRVILSNEANRCKHLKGTHDNALEKSIPPKARMICG